MTKKILCSRKWQQNYPLHEFISAKCSNFSIPRPNVLNAVHLQYICSTFAVYVHIVQQNGWFKVHYIFQYNYQSILVYVHHIIYVQENWKNRKCTFAQSFHILLPLLPFLPFSIVLPHNTIFLLWHKMPETILIIKQYV